jgi:adenylate kinase family enzyme
MEQTSPLIDYYLKAGLLVEVDGTRSIDQVTAELLTAVQ